MKRIILVFFLLSQVHLLEEERASYKQYYKNNFQEIINENFAIREYNTCPPFGLQSRKVLEKLFGTPFGEDTLIYSPINVQFGRRIKIGKGVKIFFDTILMGFGHITIEDDVTIGGQCKILSNDYDPYDRDVLVGRPIVIKKGALIGAGSTILPGVTIGEYAIVHPNSVVNADVPDYAVVSGSPAKIITTLDSNKFSKK